MDFKNRTLLEIADMICGNLEGDKGFFRYRSSRYLTGFFRIAEQIFATMVQPEISGWPKPSEQFSLSPPRARMRLPSRSRASS